MGNYIGASIHPYPPAGYHPQNFSNFAGPESAGPLPVGKGRSPSRAKGGTAGRGGVVVAPNGGGAPRLISFFH